MRDRLAPIENKDTSSSPAGSTSSGEYGRGGSTYGGGGRYGGGYGYSYSGGYQSGAAGVDRRELKPSERAFLNRGFLFQAPVFEYGGFKLIELTEVGKGAHGEGGLAFVADWGQGTKRACVRHADRLRVDRRNPSNRASSVPGRTKVHIIFATGSCCCVWMMNKASANPHPDWGVLRHKNQTQRHAIHINTCFRYLLVVPHLQVFRQDDQEFVNPLNAIRCGMPAESRAAMDLLCAACQRPLDQSDGIQPTVLFSRNADVEESNERELDALPTEKVRAQCVDAGVRYSTCGCCAENGSWRPRQCS